MSEWWHTQPGSGPIGAYPDWTPEEMMDYLVEHGTGYARNYLLLAWKDFPLKGNDQGIDVRKMTEAVNKGRFPKPRIP